MSTLALRSKTAPESDSWGRNLDAGEAEGERVELTTAFTNEITMVKVAASTRDGFMPTQLVDRYISAALRRSLTEKMEDGTYFATIPALGQVWASGDSVTEADEALREIVSQWIELKIEDQDRDFPVIDTVDLNWL